MACSYITATDKDLNLLVQMRMAFVQDLHPEYDEALLARIRTGTEAYVHEQAAAGSYVGFFGVDHDAYDMMPITTMASVPVETIACTGALLVYTLPPLYGQEGRKVGHVLNFYTRKAFRKRGYGKGLMAYMIAYAKENGFSRLFLNATADGAPLYRKVGYQEVKDAMSLELE